MKRFLLLLACLIPATVLAQTATISGTVTEQGTGLPVANASVAMTDRNAYGGPGLDSVITDSAGNYTLTVTVDPPGVPTRADGAPAIVLGEILLEVTSETHEPARAGDTLGVVDCFYFCELDDARQPELVGLININAGDTLTQDFVLAPGATISGTVQGSGGPLANVPVSVFTDEASERMALLGLTFTDAGGNYTFDIALKAGTYYAGAGTDQFVTEPLPYGNFVSQAYSGFSCEYLTCVVTATTPISLTAGSAVTGIDFDLQPGGLMTGQILDAATGEPVSDPDYTIIRIWTPDDGLQLATFFVLSDLFGPEFDSSYRIEGLSGSYILEIDPIPSLDTNLLRMLNDTSSCPFAGCDRGEGVPVSLLPGSPVAQDFTLGRGGKITGLLTDSATGAPVVGNNAIAMTVVDAAGAVVGGGIIGSDGVFTTADGIAPGNYFVTTGLAFAAQSLSGQGFAERIGGNFVDQAHSGVDCPGLACDLRLATPVTVTADGLATGIDFDLATGFVVSGTVTDAATDSPLAGRNVEIYTPAGQLVALELTDSSGVYQTGGLPDGDYRVLVKDGGRVILGRFGENGLGYFGQVFGSGADCVQELCSPASGTNVTIAGADAPNIDFALNSGPTISGQVLDASSGLPIRLTVDVFDASGAAIGAWSTVSSDDASYRTSALTPGSYTLIPRLTRSYSLSGPTTVPKGAASAGGSLTIEITDSDVVGAQLSVVQSLIFAGGFETR